MVKATRRCVHADYLVRAVVTLVICGATVALTGCGGEIASGHRAKMSAVGRDRSAPATCRWTVNVRTDSSDSMTPV